MQEQKNQGGQNNQSKQSGLSWSAPQNQQQQANKMGMPSNNNKPASSNDKSAAKYAGMAVVGIIAGVLIAWGWVSFQNGPDATSGANATSTSGSTTGGNNSGTIGGTGTVGMGSNPALTIMSPQPAGTSVAVTKAIVSAPTWIVVYENNNGGPGNALGAALFFPERQTGTVELLRGTLPGKTYLAVKQLDNGDRKFSLRDDQFVSEGGEVQWVTFETK